MNKKIIFVIVAILIFIIGFLWLKKAAPPVEPVHMESPLSNDLPDPTASPTPEIK